MTQSRHFTGFVVVTSGTVATFTALCGTGGCLGDCPCAVAVTQCCYSFLFNKNRITDRAMLTLCQTGFRTGRRNRLVDHLGMTGSRDGFCLVMVAAAAVSATGTGFCTSSFLGDGPAAHIMTQGVYVGILVSVTAAGTGVGRIALLGTGGGSDCGLVVMAQRCDLTGFVMVAVCAVPALGSLFRTGGCLALCPCAKAVTLGRDGLTGTEFCSAALAVGIAGVTCGSTGCFLGIPYFCTANMVGHIQLTVGSLTARADCLVLTGCGTAGMTQGIYISIFVGIAAGAGVGGIALFCTGRSGDNCRVPVGMLQRRDRFLLCRTADLAGVGADTGRLLGGLLSYYALIPAVTLGRDGLTGTEFRSAALAVGIAGITGFCTGCFPGISHFRAAGVVGLVQFTVGCTAAGADCLVLTGGSTAGMTQSIYKVVPVCIVTGSTGMGGIALFCAGGRGHRGNKVVGNHRNHRSFVMLTLLAVPLLLALFRTGSFFDNIPITIGMGCRYILVIEGISAAGAGVAGISVLAAGRFNRNHLVAMPQCRRVIALIVIGTTYTAVVGIALLCTGGRYYRSCHRVGGLVAQAAADGIVIAIASAIHIQHHIGAVIEHIGIGVAGLLDLGNRTGDDHFLQSGGVADTDPAQGLNALLKGNGLQLVAEIKCLLTDGFDRTGNRDGCQAVAIQKCRGTDLGYCAGNRNAMQTGTAVKQAVGDLSDIRR